MTLVVADASPIRYLVLIGHADVLPQVYGRVVLPGAVIAELTHASAPAAVQNWAANAPHWVEIKEPVSIPDRELGEELDRGETAAITLA